MRDRAGARGARSPDDIVREAVALWEEHRTLRITPAPKHTPAEAAERIIELRTLAHCRRNRSA